MIQWLKFCASTAGGGGGGEGMGYIPGLGTKIPHAIMHGRKEELFLLFPFIWIFSSVLVSYCCKRNYPKIWWLKTLSIYYLKSSYAWEIQGRLSWVILAQGSMRLLSRCWASSLKSWWSQKIHFQNSQSPSTRLIWSLQHGSLMRLLPTQPLASPTKEQVKNHTAFYDFT